MEYGSALPFKIFWNEIDRTRSYRDIPAIKSSKVVGLSCL